MVEIEYIDCRVTIHDDEHASFECPSYHRGVSVDAPEEDRRIFQDELARLAIARIQRWIEVNGVCERDDLILLGANLYRLLFHGKIGEEFRHSYEQFKDQLQKNENLRLRLTLVFHKKAEKLAAYPWEFLHMRHDEKGFFLAGQETHLILTRFVPETAVVHSLQKEEEEALRILVAYSSPSDDALGTIDAKEVIDAIKDLKPKQEVEGDDEAETAKIDVEVEVVENLRKDELKSMITSFKPHVFHFIGHGDAGMIALVADDDEIDRRELASNKSQTRWCDSETVNDLFAEHKPSLVFLHACKGAASFEKTLQSFTSTARELVYWEIPAVIGMQFAIENADAATFAKRFYKELANGNPIDEAVSIGRRELGSNSSQSWADPRFGTPLVYLQAHRAIIAAPTHVPGGNGGGRPVKSYECPNPSCQMKIKRDFRSCPRCRTKIVRCENDHPVAADWDICAYCGALLRKAGGPVGARKSAATATSEASSALGGDGDAAFE